MNAPGQHRRPVGLRDRIAYGFVKLLRVFAETFFAKRYGNRIAGLPAGPVGPAPPHVARAPDWSTAT